LGFVPGNRFTPVTRHSVLPWSDFAAIFVLPFAQDIEVAVSDKLFESAGRAYAGKIRRCFAGYAVLYRQNRPEI
jgi:hypothetical protein